MYCNKWGVKEVEGLELAECELCASTSAVDGTFMCVCTGLYQVLLVGGEAYCPFLLLLSFDFFVTIVVTYECVY